MNSQRVKRLLRLIQLLQTNTETSVDDMAKDAGVSRRTVFRDLDLLYEAGVAYRFDRSSKQYAPQKHVLLPPVTLSHAEALSLLLAARYLLGRGISSDAQAAASAGMKIEGLLPVSIRDYLGPLIEKMPIREGPASDHQSINGFMPVIQESLVNKQKLGISYDSYYEGKVLDVVVQPYRLTYIHRGWYLIAFSETESEMRTYKVERIIKGKVLNLTYEMDKDFDLDAYFGDAWQMIRGDKRYHVKIKFLKKVAANVDEIRWHRTQRTQFDEEGSLTFEVDVEGLNEISWWILGYGDQAEILEPPELRDMIAGHAQRMLNMYDS